MFDSFKVYLDWLTVILLSIMLDGLVLILFVDATNVLLYNGVKKSIVEKKLHIKNVNNIIIPNLNIYSLYIINCNIYLFFNIQKFFNKM